MITTRLLQILCTFLLSSSIFAQVSASSCGSLRNQYGPYEYRSDKFVQRDNESHRTKLALVEGAHFTPMIENLIVAKSGRNANNLIGDELDYVLRVFPNHHRALLALKRLVEKEKKSKPEGLRYEGECYFERALRFSPDDTIARIIYSTYLSSNKREPEAVAQLQQATVIAADNPFTHYNIGLAYFDMKMYDKALVQAHRAIALGFERTQLRELLQKSGHWQELTTTQTDATTAEIPVSRPVAPPASAVTQEQ